MKSEQSTSGSNQRESRSEVSVKMLQGRWRAVYSEVDGQMTSVSEFSTIVQENKGNQFVVEKNGETVAQGRFSIDTSVSPHEIVYTYSKGADIFLGGPRPGAFQVVGDTLKTCMGAVGHRSVQDLGTSPNSESVLTVFQRVGSEEGADIRVSAARAISQW